MDPSLSLASHVFMHPDAGMMLTRFHYAALAFSPSTETISILAATRSFLFHVGHILRHLALPRQHHTQRSVQSRLGTAYCISSRLLKTDSICSHRIRPQSASPTPPQHLSTALVPVPVPALVTALVLCIFCPSTALPGTSLVLRPVTLNPQRQPLPQQASRCKYRYLHPPRDPQTRSALPGTPLTSPPSVPPPGPWPANAGHHSSIPRAGFAAS